MNQVVELLFKYHERNYSCIVSISNVREGTYVHFELLHEELIDLFEGPDIHFLGDEGYRKLPAYKDHFARPLLLHMVSCLQTVRHVLQHLGG